MSKPITLMGRNELEQRIAELEKELSESNRRWAARIQTLEARLASIKQIADGRAEDYGKQ